MLEKLKHKGGDAMRNHNDTVAAIERDVQLLRAKNKLALMTYREERERRRVQRVHGCLTLLAVAALIMFLLAVIGGLLDGGRM